MVYTVAYNLAYVQCVAYKITVTYAFDTMSPYNTHTHTHGYTHTHTHMRARTHTQKASDIFCTMTINSLIIINYMITEHNYFVLQVSVMVQWEVHDQDNKFIICFNVPVQISG